VITKRVLTAAGTRKGQVLVESGDEEERWGTVGVSENIIEASTGPVDGIIIKPENSG
jgi:hypothetical protein